MVTLKGLIDFEGTLGGINSYMLNGKRVLRQSRPSLKEQIKTGANYERTRENNMEFSGAVAAAKVLRRSLMPVSRGFVDASWTGRLQGRYRDMIAVSSGKRGQRTFDPLQHTDAILAIPFNKDLHLDAVLRVKPVISMHPAGNAATLSLSVNTATDLFTVDRATHAACIFAIALQPAFEYNTHSNTYQPAGGLDQQYMQQVSSALIPLHVDAVVDISLTIPLPVLPAQTERAWISVLGIRYHQQIGFKTYPLETGKAMGFVAVI